MFFSGITILASLTIENYLKTIYQISGAADTPALTGQLASALQVAPGTVTSMLRTLSESGLAQYTPYEGVRLTEAGKALALRVVRRHRLIELFLVRTLHLSWDEVHAEAENMEHAVSDWLVDRIDQVLGFPSTDPHGDPIPRADGTIKVAEGMPLDEWPVGKRFQLQRVLDQSSEFLRYLAETGLRLGAEGILKTHRTEAGLLVIGVDNAEQNISRDSARKLLVVHPS